jgi:hypothetical protein
MSQSVLLAADLAVAYRRAADRAGEFHALSLTFDRVVASSRLQLGAMPWQLDADDARAVRLDEDVARDLFMLAGQPAA